MNIEFYIARRIFSVKGEHNKISRPVVNIAVAGISLGMIIMILAIAIVTGFKKEIRSKVVGFGGSMQIVNYDLNYSFESVPVDKNQSFYPELENEKGINHIQIFATKAGIIKTEEELEGVIFKGISSDFNWDFFNKNMVKGESFVLSDTGKTNKIVISKVLSDLLKIDVGDEVFAYFIQNPPRMRKFVVSGIFNTRLVEFDKMFVLADIRHIQKLNDWSDNQISGFEVFIDNFNDLDKMTTVVKQRVGYGFNADGSKLRVISIIEKYPHLFDWMNLFNTNVWVILILMTVVAGFNMVSGLLIIILERTRMIGTLKALGATNNSIRKIFLYNIGFMVIKGMIWGNIIGLLICLIQKYTGIITLDPESYYVDVVPVSINYLYILLLNLGTLLLTMTMLILPSLIISRITPVKAIKFN
ncbi:MAG: ABC transporter permease [Marinilabiliales bacterium]